MLSLALPLSGGDPLLLLPHLEPTAGDGFRFLWDGAPGLCIAAAGRTNSLELSGPRRFELAQRFSAVSLDLEGLLSGKLNRDHLEAASRRQAQVPLA